MPGYPVTSDVAALLAGVDIDTAGLDLAAPLKAAIAAFEALTGYRPFYIPADAIATERVFEVRASRAVAFDNGLTTLTSVTVNGTAYDRDVSFRLKPDNAAADGRPWTWLAFTGRAAFRYGSVYPLLATVKGKWGYASILPDDVWQAVLKQAAAGALMASADGAVGPATSVGIAPVSGSYAVGLLPKDRVDSWQAEFKAIALYYQRRTI